MLLTALTMLLTAADVQTTAENTEPQPKWAVNYALTSPSVIGASFNLTPQANTGLGVLGSVTRPAFTNTLSLERVLGEHLTGVVAATFGYSQLGASLSSVSGGGLLGVHWYQSRPLDGFWVGPEVLFQLTTLQVPNGIVGASRTQAVGLRGRAGWTQRFGAHFLVAASAGVGGNIDWTTGAFAQTTLNLAVDGTLSAGLMF